MVAPPPNRSTAQTANEKTGGDFFSDLVDAISVFGRGLLKQQEESQNAIKKQQEIASLFNPLMGGSVGEQANPAVVLRGLQNQAATLSSGLSTPTLVGQRDRGEIVQAIKDALPSVIDEMDLGVEKAKPKTKKTEEPETELEKTQETTQSRAIQKSISDLFVDDVFRGRFADALARRVFAQED